MSSFDARHLLPMVSDFLQLSVGSIFNRRHREGLIDVGRSIRHNAFEARDSFPSMELNTVVAHISGGASCPVILPDPSDLIGNTIGGVIPYYYIGSLAMAKRPKSTVEIGTYLGASALTVALNSPEDATIYTVDLPEQSSEGDVSTLTKGDIKLVNTARDLGIGSAFRNHPLKRKIVQIHADSATIDFSAITPEADFAIIDGGHSYELVKNDTEKCLRILKKDGVILWDDYRWNLPGVHKYMNELSRTLPIWRISGTQYILYSEKLGR